MFDMNTIANICVILAVVYGFLKFFGDVIKTFREAGSYVGGKFAALGRHFKKAVSEEEAKEQTKEEGK